MPNPSPFQHLTVGRVYLVADDILNKRTVALRSFRYGVYAEQDITANRDKIAALPEAVRGRPEAAALADEDADHDGYGGAVWHLVEAYRLAPDTTPDERDALDQVRAVFGTLDDLTAKYDVEAKAAAEKRAKLKAVLPLLSRFPLTKNKTLADWAEAHIAAGENLGKLLSKRADAGDRALAGRLRSSGIGLLNRLREELTKARREDPSLAPTLDDDLFAYADLMETTSATEAAAEKKAEEQRKVADKAKKAESKAKKADDKNKQAAEAERRVKDAQRVLEGAKQAAAEAQKEADDAQKEALAAASPPPAPTTPATPPAPATPAASAGTAGTGGS
jgi:hypothetical protein